MRQMFDLVEENAYAMALVVTPYLLKTAGMRMSVVGDRCHRKDRNAVLMQAARNG